LTPTVTSSWCFDKIKC